MTTPHSPGGPSAALNDPALQQFERLLLAYCEAEHCRIGQDLHDGIGQQLTGIHLMCKTLERRLRLTEHPETEFARSIATLVDDAIGQVRRTVAGMVPPEVENQDAVMALAGLCRRMESLHQIRCEFINRFDAVLTDPQAIKHLYFVAGEAVHNAIRHGGADQFRVDLSGTAGEGCLTVRSNGRLDEHGFPGIPGLGISSMQLRAKALNGWVRFQPEENGTLTVICAFSVDEGGFPS